MHERMVVATVQRRLAGDWSVELQGGVIMNGDIVLDDGDVHRVQLGWVAAARGSYRIVNEGAWVPFVTAALTLAGSHTPIKQRVAGGTESSVTALDGRVSLSVGKTFFGMWTPYLRGGVFGGPVLWDRPGLETRRGTSRDHYQVGIGSTVSLRQNLRAYVDWVPLGQTSLSLGVAMTF